MPSHCLAGCIRYVFSHPATMSSALRARSTSQGIELTDPTGLGAGNCGVGWQRNVLLPGHEAALAVTRQGGEPVSWAGRR